MKLFSPASSESPNIRLFRRRCDKGDESLTEIGCSDNVSGWTIGRLRE